MLFSLLLSSKIRFYESVIIHVEQVNYPPITQFIQKFALFSLSQKLDVAAFQKIFQFSLGTMVQVNAQLHSLSSWICTSLLCNQVPLGTGESGGHSPMLNCSVLTSALRGKFAFTCQDLSGAFLQSFDRSSGHIPRLWKEKSQYPRYPPASRGMWSQMTGALER